MQLVKRNGNTVDFEKDRIYAAIVKAAQAAGVEFDKEKFEKYSEEIVAKFNGTKKINAQQVTNALLQVLAKHNETQIITSYIEFDSGKRKIEDLKEEIGVEDDLDLPPPTLHMLKNRYLLKDDSDSLIETPKQMFKRVARYISMMDIFYDEEIYSKDEIDKNLNEVDIDRNYFENEVAESFSFSEYKCIVRMYNNLVREKHMKVDFDEFIKKAKEIRPSYRAFYEMMARQEFMPNSPTLINANRDFGTLSACFLLEIEDDMIDILEKVKTAGLIFKNGGGCGFYFGNLRPKGGFIKSTKGYSSGPISFMELYDILGEVVRQAGVRDAAEIAILPVWHADIYYPDSSDPNAKQGFITAKQELDKLQNFNISVSVTDLFFKSVVNDDKWELIDPNTKKVTRTVKAKTLFDQIVYNAWKTAEPGLMLVDEHNRDNPILNRKIKGTNPCITGDTLIAVADGRNAVSIKELAKEEKDIPVYTQNIKAKKEGRKKVEIKMSRNPRLTRKNVDVYEVILDDNSSVKATADHKFMLRNGKYKNLKNLNSGDSLMPFNTEIRNDYITVNSNVHLYDEYTNPEVKEIKYIGKEDVYNITVDDNYNYMIVTDFRENMSLTGICVSNCGEIGLFGNESCNLGSINLSAFVRENGNFRWRRFKIIIKRAVHFLDNVIDANKFNNDDIRNIVRKYRRIGLGIMGYSEMLMKMDMVYGSEEALEFTEKLGKVFAETAAEASNELAKERGVFLEWENSIFEKVANDNLDIDDIFKIKDHNFRDAYEFKYNLWKKYPYMRNVAMTTIAPTGSISFICNTTSGLEPLFAPIIVREVLGKKVRIFNEYFEKLLEKAGLYTNRLIESILNNEENTLENLLNMIDDLDISLTEEQKEIVEKIEKYIITTHDLSVDAHFKTQAIWQKYISNSISKTINLPPSATVEDVKKAYIKAHNLHLKGITVYREGSREGVLHFNEKKKREKDDEYKMTKNECLECVVDLEGYKTYE